MKEKYAVVRGVWCFKSKAFPDFPFFCFAGSRDVIGNIITYLKEIMWIEETARLRCIYGKRRKNVDN